jgi:hypothetical protein
VKQKVIMFGDEGAGGQVDSSSLLKSKSKLSGVFFRITNLRVFAPALQQSIA